MAIFIKTSHCRDLHASWRSAALQEDAYGTEFMLGLVTLGPYQLDPLGLGTARPDECVVSVVFVELDFFDFHLSSSTD